MNRKNDPLFKKGFFFFFLPILILRWEYQEIFLGHLLILCKVQHTSGPGFSPFLCSAAKSVFDICACKFISANRSVERALLRPWGMEEAPAQAADVARGLNGARPRWRAARRHVA